MISIITTPTTTQVLLVGSTKPSLPNIPLSRFLSRSITTVSTTTADDGAGEALHTPDHQHR